MAVFAALPFQSRFSSGSTLSLSVNDDDFERHDPDLTCSPFSLSCAAAKQNFSILPQRVSTLTLRPARYDANLITYQNGQITPTSPQLSIVKADKTPFPPPLPSTWTWSPENSSCLASLPPTRSEDGPSNWYGSTLQSPEELLRWQRRHLSVSKPLLSPIKFSSDAQERTTDQIEELSHPDCIDESELQLSYDDANSFHSSDWDLTAPSRRLSYGEPLDMIEARSFLEPTGSTKLRGKAGWLRDDKNFDIGVGGTIKAHADRMCHSEPSRRKNRLWLDLDEDDEKIREAHATAVTTSPSKPRMISIRPRRATTESSPGKPRSPAVSIFQPGITTFLPETPPQSPTPSIETPERPPAPSSKFLIESNDSNKQERQQQAFNRIRSRTTWSMTPSTSDVPKPWSSQTVRRVVPPSPNVPISPENSRPATPPPMSVNRGFKFSELTTWILTELETATEGEANQTLKLDSLVIQQLRLPPKKRRMPRQSSLTPAYSSFSATQGPLSSHASPSQFTTPPPETSDSPSIATRSTSSRADPTLSILTRIFPFAPQPSLSHLLATILAQQFVSTIYTPLLRQVATITTPPFAARHISNHHHPSPTTTQVEGLPEHIPSKARAMLGLPPLSPTGKSRNGRPPLPCFWRKVEKMEWRHRIGVLEAGLHRSVRQVMRELIGGDEWKNGEKWLDALVGAVGESVRMGEAARIAL